MSSIDRSTKTADSKPSLAAPTRRLSPAEFQIFVAIHYLDKPTIREVREFIAQLPPLSISLRRTKSPANESRGAMPSYNNVNTLLLRMLASGTVTLEDQEDEVARRLVPLWDFEQTLAYSIEFTLRDYLAWKPLLPRVLEIVVAQIAERTSPADLPELHRAVDRALAATAEHHKFAVTEVATPAPPRKRSSRRTR